MGDTERDPPTPPFEAGTEETTEPETVRERVRGVAATLTDEQDVATIADMADCSKEGARSALREYADLGVVRQTNENPERYERNGAFFRFRRGLDLAERQTADELANKYLELTVRHESFAEQFDSAHPREVAVDERENPDLHDAVMEWQRVIEQAADVREAHWQATRQSLPPLDAAETRADDAATAETPTDDSPAVEVDPKTLAALAETPAAATLSVEILRVISEGLQSNEELRTLLSDLNGDEDDELGSSRGSVHPQ